VPAGEVVIAVQAGEVRRGVSVFSFAKRSLGDHSLGYKVLLRARGSFTEVQRPSHYLLDHASVEVDTRPELRVPPRRRRLLRVHVESVREMSVVYRVERGLCAMSRRDPPVCALFDCSSSACLGPENQTPVVELVQQPHVVPVQSTSLPVQLSFGPMVRS